MSHTASPTVNISDDEGQANQSSHLVISDSKLKGPLSKDTKRQPTKSLEQVKSKKAKKKNSRASTPDHQELIEEQKMRVSMRADVADENEDYVLTSLQRATIKDINK